jgi:hypothetical protein
MIRILIILLFLAGCSNKITRVGIFSSSKLNHMINTNKNYFEYLRKPFKAKFNKANDYQNTLDSLNGIYDSLVKNNGDTIEIKLRINKLWKEYSNFTENQLMNRDYIPQQQINFNRIVQEAIQAIINENDLNSICDTDSNIGEDCNNISNVKRIDITDLIIDKIQIKLKNGAN